MKKTNNVIQSLWIGKEISLIEKLSMKSFLANGHEYHLYTYNKIPGIPKGVVVKDANEIINEKEIFEYKGVGGVAGFSDWFRYKLLYEKGGYWADTDMVCLKPLDFTDDIVFSFEDGEICQSFFKCSKGHDVMKHMENICRSPNTILPYDTFRIKKRKFVRKYFRGNKRNNIRFAETGPIGLKKAMEYFDLLDKGLPIVYFCPLCVCRWQILFDDTFNGSLSFLDKSYCIHLFNEALRRRNIDKNQTFHKDSCIELLKRRYL